VDERRPISFRVLLLLPLLLVVVRRRRHYDPGFFRFSDVPRFSLRGLLFNTSYDRERDALFLPIATRQQLVLLVFVRSLLPPDERRRPVRPNFFRRFVPVQELLLLLAMLMLRTLLPFNIRRRLSVPRRRVSRCSAASSSPFVVNVAVGGTSASRRSSRQRRRNWKRRGTGHDLYDRSPLARLACCCCCCFVPLRHLSHMNYASALGNGDCSAASSSSLGLHFVFLRGWLLAWPSEPCHCRFAADGRTEAGDSHFRDIL